MNRRKRYVRRGAGATEGTLIRFRDRRRLAVSFSPCLCVQSSTPSRIARFRVVFVGRGTRAKTHENVRPRRRTGQTVREKITTVSKTTTFACTSEAVVGAVAWQCRFCARDVKKKPRRNEYLRRRRRLRHLDRFCARVIDVKKKNPAAETSIYDAAVAPRHLDRSCAPPRRASKFDRAAFFIAEACSLKIRRRR